MGEMVRRQCVPEMELARCMSVAGFSDGCDSDCSGDDDHDNDAGIRYQQHRMRDFDDLSDGGASGCSSPRLSPRSNRSLSPRSPTSPLSPPALPRTVAGVEGGDGTIAAAQHLQAAKAHSLAAEALQADVQHARKRTKVAAQCSLM